MYLENITYHEYRQFSITLLHKFLAGNLLETFICTFMIQKYHLLMLTLESVFSLYIEYVLTWWIIIYFSFFIFYYFIIPYRNQHFNTTTTHWCFGLLLPSKLRFTALTCCKLLKILSYGTLSGKNTSFPSLPPPKKRKANHKSVIAVRINFQLKWDFKVLLKYLNTYNIYLSQG